MICLNIQLYICLFLYLPDCVIKRYPHLRVYWIVLYTTIGTFAKWLRILFVYAHVQVTVAINTTMTNG